MRKWIAAGLTLALLGVAVPATAGETVSTGYSVALGASVNHGIPGVRDRVGVIACLGPPEEEFCQEAGIDPIGGFRGTPLGGPYSKVTINVIDDLSGSNVFTGVCIYADDHSLCGAHQDDVFTESCGVSYTLNRDPDLAISSATPVAGFVFNVYVDPSTTSTCLGTSGSATAIFE